VNGLPHAAVRAKERYGIDLSKGDIIDLAKRCYAGEGLMETTRDGKRMHALIVGERVLWLVYLHPKGGRSYHQHGTVLTIMPPQIAAVRSSRDTAYRRRRLGRAA